MLAETRSVAGGSRWIGIGARSALTPTLSPLGERECMRATPIARLIPLSLQWARGQGVRASRRASCYLVRFCRENVSSGTSALYFTSLNSISDQCFSCTSSMRWTTGVHMPSIFSAFTSVQTL